MTGHIEQIRHRYDQFSRGDIWGATEDWADDLVWEGGNSAKLPMGGTLVTDTLQLARLLELATDEKGKADAIDNW